MTRVRRLLTVGHSYVVALNRRLADEMSRIGAGRWEVTAAAPEFMHGDLRPIRLEGGLPGSCPTVAIPAVFTKHIHFMLYGPRLRQLLAERWDIVHAWEEPYILAGCQLAGWVRPCSRLVYATFQNISKRYPPPFNWLERYAINRSSGWIAFGQTVHAVHHQRPGYRGKPHQVIPVGVDVGAFQPDAIARDSIRRSLGWSGDGPPVVGFLGRFVPEKGIRLLMSALDELKPAWRAIFVGGGPLDCELRNWATRHMDRVRVVTGVTHDLVPDYLNAMDILAAPSQTLPRWKEQLGRMLIEAFACGVAVIGSDSGEIPHVIGDAGRVVGEADQAAWVATLSDLLENPGLRRELAQRGRQRAETVFAWPVVAQAHLEFFSSLLDSNGSTV